MLKTNAPSIVRFSLRLCWWQSAKLGPFCIAKWNLPITSAIVDPSKRTFKLLFISAFSHFKKHCCGWHVDCYFKERTPGAAIGADSRRSDRLVAFGSIHRCPTGLPASLRRTVETTQLSSISEPCHAGGALYPLQTLYQ